MSDLFCPGVGVDWSNGAVGAALLFALIQGYVGFGAGAGESADDAVGRESEGTGDARFFQGPCFNCGIKVRP